MYVRVNVWFFGKYRVLCFHVTLVLRFAFLPYQRYEAYLGPYQTYMVVLF